MRPPVAYPHYVAPSAPADTRIYAVGDIHGRADLLADTIARIDDDISRRPIRYVLEIYLGDYIDRGPDSKTVLDLLAVRLVRHHAVCLRGNHEELLQHFLDDPAVFAQWRRLGGLQTLASYGVVPRDMPVSEVNLQRRFLSVFPRAHVLLLQCLRDSFTCGDFFFAHAGVRPNVPIEQQHPEDLLWIRQEFLNSDEDHGKYVVHGHTPVPHPDIRHNRINIDTGAWRSGTLTCIAIEGTTILVL
ncbi:metallophosphoesterase [Bradyrhizobium sp. Ai1a-2]|uniref:metallophosphoesterase n=1 Tax=Bradyrhizobium sp. Ai1a-2 TaxID=196490 RepID=UPI001267D9C7|nr:metallophosphoesterase [Bradyrhizobium sp. Ai1a-2]